jgi:serine/threonine-protein kinase HipA
VAFKPRDELTLWWLGNPADPRLIGELRLVSGGRAVGLQYAEQWLATGFALSADLPLRGELFVPAGKDAAAGAVNDARPDRWGERVIRKFEKSPRMSVLEYLLFAGDDRSGALGVSQRADAYDPWPTAPIPNLSSIEEMAEVVRKVLANEPVPELQRRLVRPGVSFGGMRPKSVVSIDGDSWMVKFSDAGDDLDVPLIEHATMTLAALCGIQVAATRALDLASGHAVAVRRFDRIGPARVHAVSANVALRAAGEDLGYPQLSQLLRRLAPAQDIARQQEQLFRRMVFNVLVDNTDDHEKNHVLLRQEDGSYLLAPAFDLVPSAQGLGYQAMQVGDAGVESSLKNALSQSRAFGLKEAGTRAIAQEVARRMDGWKEHFTREGVTDADIEVLAQYIDGDNLRTQRMEFAAGRHPAARPRPVPKRG